jgi:hypothetical protein
MHIFGIFYLGLAVQRSVIATFSADNAHTLKLFSHRIFSWGETPFAFV